MAHEYIPSEDDDTHCVRLALKLLTLQPGERLAYYNGPNIEREAEMRRSHAELPILVESLRQLATSIEQLDLYYEHEQEDRDGEPHPYIRHTYPGFDLDRGFNLAHLDLLVRVLEQLGTLYVERGTYVAVGRKRTAPAD